jgi:hypothetical protein
MLPRKAKLRLQASANPAAANPKWPAEAARATFCLNCRRRAA